VHLITFPRAANDPFPPELELRLAGVTLRGTSVAARLAKHAHLSDWVALAPKLRCDHLVLAHLPPMPAKEISVLLAPLAERLPGRLVAWSAAK